MKATTKNAHKIAAAISGHVANFLEAKLIAEAKREEIDARHAKILAAYNFSIKTPGDAWEMEDEEYDRYDQLCDQANREAGYDLKPGYCPACIAETDLLVAELRLVEAAAPLLGINAEAAKRSLKRRELIDNLIGLVAAADRETR